jgi:hypothetical protein
MLNRKINIIFIICTKKTVKIIFSVIWYLNKKEGINKQRKKSRKNLKEEFK